MKVLLNDNGFITNFAIVGDLIDGLEVQDPTNEEHFFDHFSSYRVVDGVVVFDETKDIEVKTEESMQEYRIRREKECFPIINRGKLWYDTLTDEQTSELNKWYHEWLDGTPTQTIPTRPTWLK